MRRFLVSCVNSDSDKQQYFQQRKTIKLSLYFGASYLYCSLPAGEEMGW